MSSDTARQLIRPNYPLKSRLDFQPLKYQTVFLLNINSISKSLPTKCVHFISPEFSYFVSVVSTTLLSISAFCSLPSGHYIIIDRNLILLDPRLEIFKKLTRDEALKEVKMCCKPCIFFLRTLSFVLIML